MLNATTCLLNDSVLDSTMRSVAAKRPLAEASEPRHRDCTARQMSPWQRRDLALAAMTQDRPKTHLAHQHQVSRKFVYQQHHKARQAVDQAFGMASDPSPDSAKVLFQLPVTAAWLDQLALGLILICRSSLRGVQELLGCVFDYHGMSQGYLHQLLQKAAAQARQINHSQNLSGVRVGAHDEIFHGNRPVLTGVDVESTYCYLLAQETGRDQITWATHLLQLQDQGLALQYAVADFAKGIAAGHQLALPDVPLYGDVFHALQALQHLSGFLERQALACISAVEKLQRQRRRCKKHVRKLQLAQRLRQARCREQQMILLADEVAILLGWMQQDILAGPGEDLQTRCQLYDFVVEQLQQRQALCPHRIRPVVSLLQNHRDALLGFVGVIDQALQDLAHQHQIPIAVPRAISQLLALDDRHALYWQRREQLHEQLGDQFQPLYQAVQDIIDNTPKASSMVENLNGRLRQYLHLRRHIGHGYLDLLRFFLNHRCYLRSRKPQRVGKSPTQLLTGQPHPHWLQLLGYQRFCRN